MRVLMVAAMASMAFVATSLMGCEAFTCDDAGMKQMKDKYEKGCEDGEEETDCFCRTVDAQMTDSEATANQCDDDSNMTTTFIAHTDTLKAQKKEMCPTT